MAACAGVASETVHLLAPPQSYKGGLLELNVVEESIEIDGRASEVAPPPTTYLEVVYAGRTFVLRNFELKGAPIVHLEVIVWEVTGDVSVEGPGGSELRNIKLSGTQRVEVPREH